MPTTLEVAQWRANEAAQKDIGLLKAPVEALKGAPGVQKVYYGLQTEEPNAYLVVGWDSLDAHESARKDTDRYAKIREGLGATLAEGASLDLIHGRFLDSDALTSILAAPVIEFAVVTPKEGHGDVVKSILTHLVDAVNEPNCPAVGGTFGPIIEKDGSYLLLIGWRTIEEHWDTVKSSRNVEELLGNAELKVTHVKLISE